MEICDDSVDGEETRAKINVTRRRLWPVWEDSLMNISMKCVANRRFQCCLFKREVSNCSKKAEVREIYRKKSGVRLDVGAMES